ncbi:DUF2283 domain-containing protein [Methanobrevibacter sp. DSM 116169]|uniref:DUF2283 domain-containing protein n=1 Tax=Methanobrevibacter sp. DSM 116169 TaxID=3242727 RepID=UPI0038FC43CF
MEHIKIKAEYDYDYQYDVMNIGMIDKYDYKETLELDKGVFLDFDKNNIPVNLEIIDASKIIKLDKNNLNKAKIKMTISVKNGLISVKVIFGFKLHNKLVSESIVKNIANNYNIPEMEANIATI